MGVTQWFRTIDLADGEMMTPLIPRSARGCSADVIFNCCGKTKRKARAG